MPNEIFRYFEEFKRNDYEEKRRREIEREREKEIKEREKREEKIISKLVEERNQEIKNHILSLEPLKNLESFIYDIYRRIQTEIWEGKRKDSKIFSSIVEEKISEEYKYKGLFKSSMTPYFKIYLKNKYILDPGYEFISIKTSTKVIGTLSAKLEIIKDIPHRSILIPISFDPDNLFVNFFVYREFGKKGWVSLEEFYSNKRALAEYYYFEATHLEYRECPKDDSWKTQGYL